MDFTFSKMVLTLKYFGVFFTPLLGLAEERYKAKYSLGFGKNHIICITQTSMPARRKLIALVSFLLSTSEENHVDIQN